MTEQVAVAEPEVVEMTPAEMPTSEVKAEEWQVHQIRVNEIQPNPKQPRTHFGEDKLEELGESIKVKGVRQPITVRNISQGDVRAFEIVTGERRWRACQLIGRETIPALVIEATDLESLELALVENGQREDLTPLDEARALATLCELHGGNKSAAARAYSKPLTHVTDMLSLLELPESVQDLIDLGKLNIAQAKVLLEIEDADKQIQWADMAVRLGLTAVQLKGRTQNLTHDRKKANRSDKGITFKGLNGHLIAAFDAMGAVAVEKLNAEQRQTVSQQLDVLAGAIQDLRTKLGVGAN